MKQKFNSALIFLNGDEENLSYAKKYADEETLLIGCDGGADKISGLGLKPAAVVGDFDSIKNLPEEIKNLPKKYYGKEITIAGVAYVRYPGDKDFLDVELAINFAVGKGLKKITLVNISGDEIDHLLGTLIILARQHYRGLDISAITPRHRIFTVGQKAVIEGKRGDKLSLIPLYGPVKVESSSSLKYDPAKYSMSLSRNTGISNELTAKKATLHIRKGRFLVVQHC